MTWSTNQLQVWGASNWVLHRALFIPRLHDEGAHGSILILAHSKRVQLAQHQTGQHQSCCWAIPDVTPYSRSNIFRRSKRKKAASLSECAFGCYTPLSRFMIASLMITNDHLESMIRDCVCSGWKKGFHAFNGGRIWLGWMAWTWLGRSSGGFSLLQPASACFWAIHIFGVMSNKLRAVTGRFNRRSRDLLLACSPG